MTDIRFERGTGNPEYLFTFWPAGELRTFRDRAAAEAFADRQGLRPIFPKTEDSPPIIDDGHDGSEI